MEEMRKKLYLSEFIYHNGTHSVVMNIVDICTVKNEIAVAVTDEGKPSVRKFDLKIEDGRFYFEFGMSREQISVDEFEQVDDQFATRTV